MGFIYPLHRDVARLSCGVCSVRRCTGCRCSVRPPRTRKSWLRPCGIPCKSWVRQKAARERLKRYVCPPKTPYPSPPRTHLTTLISQAADEAAKLLVSMKTMLYGTDTQEPQTELAAQLAQEFYNHDMLLHLAKNLHKLEFEVSWPHTKTTL